MRKNALMAVILSVLALGLVGCARTNLSGPTIESCDDLGDPKDVFELVESVYACGENFGGGEEVKVHVLPNGIGYTSANIISSTAVTADPSGSFKVCLGTAGTFGVGEYDIWADRNGNEELDRCEPIDTFCDVAGFFVIPEYVVGTILGLIACFAAFAVFSRSKHLHQTKAP